MRKEIIVITGAGSGLGACIAERFSAEDTILILLGRTMVKLERTAEKLKGEYRCFLLDVSVKAMVDEVFSKIFDEFGRIDRLINCAGVFKAGLTEEITEKDVNDMIDINLKGTIYPTQAVLPSMKEKDYGYIINIISMSGVRANPMEAVYCGSKFGAEGFSKAVALELEHSNVRVSNFYMGNMATELWKGTRAEEMSDFIRPEDMAELVYEMTRLRKNLVVEEVRIKNFIR